MAAAGAAAAVAGLAAPAPAPGPDSGPATTPARPPAATTAPTFSGRVRIATRLGVTLRGTFALSGAATDGGTAVARRRVSGGRVRLDYTLSGRRGTIRFATSQRCGSLRGTWRVTGGTAAYAGLSGGGTSIGAMRCAGARKPLASVHTGPVATPAPPPPPPPPPLVAAGRYGGAVAAGGPISFDVPATGRTLTGLVLDVDTTCTGGRVVRWQYRVSVAGPIPVGEDRTFSVVSGETTVSGRFGAARADGTVRARHGGTSPGGGTYTCAGESTWTASTPPPVARAGRYCGFTLQGRGICLEVAADGRSVSRIASELVLRCGTSDLTLPFVWDGALAITYDLRFRGSPRVQLPGGSAEYLVNGTFDSAGSATGSFFVQSVELERDGVRQACRSAGARWSSRLGG